MNVQVIERDGKPEYAVVPYEEWRRLLERAEEAEDVRDADRAMHELENGDDELIPGEIVHRLIEGEPPLRVWREHRGLTQAELAEKTGVTQGAVAQLESGKRRGSVELLRKMAATLQIDLDDLIWDDRHDTRDA